MENMVKFKRFYSAISGRSKILGWHATLPLNFSWPGLRKNLKFIASRLKRQLIGTKEAQLN